MPDWVYLTQQNLTKVFRIMMSRKMTMLTTMMEMRLTKVVSQAGGQLEGSFHLRSVVQGILAQVLIRHRLNFRNTASSSNLAAGRFKSADKL